MDFLLLFIFTAVISSIIITLEFFYFLLKAKHKTPRLLWIGIECCVIILQPLFFLYVADFTETNDCCSESAVFSPQNRLGIYLIIFLCMAAYLIAMLREKIFAPIPEVVLNCSLLLGFLFNILLFKHLFPHKQDWVLGLFGNAPILMLFFMKLVENQQLMQTYFIENNFTPNGYFSKLCLQILQINPLIKYPLLFVLLLPFLLLLSLFLMLFGQQPDSMIRAFTDTYKHGFSELDHLCDNVECGGHFLCSVAANGHQKIVRPIRYGERNGKKILCTRQLLIANAFEELLQNNFPKAHYYIRNKYNKIGDLVHRHYHFFNIKIISDAVYVLMKPLEWFFLAVLYTFDKKPENRIAQQYLNKHDKAQISRLK